MKQHSRKKKKFPIFFLGIKCLLLPETYIEDERQKLKYIKRYPWIRDDETYDSFTRWGSSIVSVNIQIEVRWFV